MPSPFPGMDPYLENPAFWPDFHVRFVNYWCETLADGLPDNYEARIDERVSLVEIPTGKVKRIGPDVAVTQRGASAGVSPAPQGVATFEPVTIPLLIEEEQRETRIEILHRPHRRLVGVLELLSPSNKEEPGRTGHLVKRNGLLQQAVHLVELDLLLGGRRLPLARDLPPGDYYTLVARADRRPDCQVYHWTLRQRLPAIPIPLLPPDADVWVDLSAVFNIAYERGRYARSVDYQALPSVPLGEEAQSWVLEQARAATANGR